MKLRVAKKVHEQVATGRDLCYKRSTVRRAIFLYNRMPSAIATEKWWREELSATVSEENGTDRAGSV